MVMKRIVVDSSIVIEFLRTGKGRWLDLVSTVGQKRVTLIVPVVVLGEIWSGKSMKSIKMRKDVKETLSVAEMIDLTKKDAALAGELRRNFDIPMMDAFVAACAMSHKAYLSTLNTKDFKKVKGLKIHVA